MTNNLNALILKTQPYSENSRLLFCYTKLGKTTLVAKGSQKTNSSIRVASQYLNEISFECKDFKQMMSLYQANIVNDFNHLKNEYQKLKDASLVLGLIDLVIIDDEYHNDIYQLMIETLNSTNIKVSSISFALKLLYYLGYGYDLSSNDKKVIGFNIKKGGVVFKEETLNLDLDLNQTITLLELTYLKVNEINNYLIEDIKVFKDFVYKYYLDKLDINLKTLI